MTTVAHQIALIVGDYSFDGHCRRDTVVVSSSLPKDQLLAAYKRGCEVVGFDLTKDVCSEYDDSTIPKYALQKLAKVGYSVEFAGEDGADYVSSQTFADVWLFIATKGDPSLVTTIIDPPSLNIGGYGLFS